MKIAIMCGGRGKRLGHLTEKIPKPLTKINGRVVLGLKIEQYIKQGFEDFIFCIGYKGEMIKKYIIKEYNSINAEFSDSGNDSGILNRLYNASDLFSNSVVMTYGDTITKIDISDLIKTHNFGDNYATISLAEIRNPFGVVEFDANKKITLFREKPILHYYIGYAVINKNVLLKIPKAIINSLDGEGIVSFYQQLAQINKLGAYLYSGHQLTFNTLDEYDKVKEQIKSFYTVPERDEI
jgi:glucose-1-phosphate cytidylyltransferase